MEAIDTWIVTYFIFIPLFVQGVQGGVHDVLSLQHPCVVGETER